jgi:hypothetical protein
MPAVDTTTDPELADLADLADEFRSIFEKAQERQSVIAVAIVIEGRADPAAVTYYYSEAQDHGTMH